MLPSPLARPTLRAIGTFCAIITRYGRRDDPVAFLRSRRPELSDKERFGKGAIEGVLVPVRQQLDAGRQPDTTISFGILQRLMAILIGAFYHAWESFPAGYAFRPESQGGHLGLTYSFVWIVGDLEHHHWWNHFSPSESKSSG